MANRGRKPLPTNVHKLRGTYKPCRHGDKDTEPVIETDYPAMPRWLPKEAKAEWKRVKKVMEHSGIITEADQTLLAQYCLLYGEFQKERENFQAAKHTQLRVCASELGLTPGTRDKLQPKRKKPNKYESIGKRR